MRIKNNVIMSDLAYGIIFLLKCLIARSVSFLQDLIVEVVLRECYNNNVITLCLEAF